jgi:small-conductance mechanosensitive channel
MRATIATAVLTGIAVFAARAAEAPSQPEASAAESRAVMTGDQVVQILDETVDWYRTLGAQQQAATQPSDLLLLYANRQTADKIMKLAFDFARANAELLSSEAGVKKEAEDAASEQSLTRLRKRLDEQRASIQAEIEASRRQLARTPKQSQATLQSRISVLQGQLDLLNARRNMLANMAQFDNETDATGFGANALKAHIDAIAASVPAASGTTVTPVVAPAANADGSKEESPIAGPGASLRRFGIWDLATAVLRLSAKGRTIDQIDQRTAELQQTFNTIRTPPLEQLKRLADRGDALAAQADATNGTTLRGVRDQYDTLAWLFQQTSSIVTPLNKASVLLDQYRRNLTNWREATNKQYREALEALGLRVALFVGLLAAVFLIAHLWRRAAYRYVHEARRRSRLLLLQRIVLWSLVVAIVAFVTELGSLATFAGLITAGLAVAMQSVLVSIVGYFFLIGKYGIRVGDRVQVGTVTGEVIEMGLVRLHLMELSGAGPMAPTGRVVAFANSIIFQSSGGLFKQIPGVNLAWHEVTFSLPSGADYGALKDKMVEAVTRVIADYREDIVRQTREIQKAASASEAGDPLPSVQLRFSASSVDAIVRYPVQLSQAAEIDERVSRELLNVISAHA